MIPQSPPRQPRNSSKVNLLISFVFHALLVVVVLYFAARSGLLGTQIQKITVTLEKPEKPPVKPPEPPKVEPPKVVEPPKAVALPKVVAAPPPTLAPPVVAPPAAELPSFDFDGGKLVQSSSDPVQLYKGLLEYTLRSKWNRPDNLADDDFVAEVEVAVDRAGNISQPKWQKSSGNTIWDDSVRAAIAATTSLNRPPPTNFPARVTIRFDVQSEATEPILP
jgi:outer membrane biosynthesis protein TonB